MFERYQDEARRAVVRSEEEARSLGGAHIGTEHLLLAVLTLPDAPATQALFSVGATYDRTRDEVVAGILPAVVPADADPAAHIAFDPESKQVLEEAATAALGLGHNYVGTEHLLLAMLRHQSCTGVKVLTAMGIQPDAVREVVLAPYIEAAEI
jgi:ATP-dependent Clp protease ATP-binding subunit ClpC